MAGEIPEANDLTDVFKKFPNPNDTMTGDGDDDATTAYT